MAGAVAGRKRPALRNVTNSKRYKSDQSSGVVEKSGKGRTTKKDKREVGVIETPPVAKKRCTFPYDKREVGSIELPPVAKKRFTFPWRVTRSSSARSKKLLFEKPVNSISNSTYQYSGKADDIDELDIEDPLSATEYVEGMYAFFREKELTSSARPGYMERQPCIDGRMRSILVDWLIEVHLKFKMVPEALYLTINLVDRYLELKEIERPNLQLLGVACLLIGSKYEEIYPPDLRDLVYICDRAYTRSDILNMEEDILKTLDYKVTIPSAHTFLVRYLKAAHADKKTVQLTCFVLDGTLCSYNLLHYLPSQLAAAAVLIARHTVGRNPWSPTLLKYAEYCEEEVLPVARAIIAERESLEKELLQAVHMKYMLSRYGTVANTELKCEG